MTQIWNTIVDPIKSEHARPGSTHGDRQGDRRTPTPPSPRRSPQRSTRRWMRAHCPQPRPRRHRAAGRRSEACRRGRLRMRPPSPKAAPRHGHRRLRKLRSTGRTPPSADYYVEQGRADRPARRAKSRSRPAAARTSDTSFLNGADTRLTKPFLKRVQLVWPSSTGSHDRPADRVRDHLVLPVPALRSTSALQERADAAGRSP